MVCGALQLSFASQAKIISKNLVFYVCFMRIFEKDMYLYQKNNRLTCTRHPGEGQKRRTFVEDDGMRMAGRAAVLFASPGNLLE